MPLNSLPPLFFEKYNDSIHQHLPEMNGLGINSFKAEELVEFIDSNAKKAQKIPMYRDFLNDSDNYMKPYMDKGEIVRGFYEMDNRFVSEMIEKGYFYPPRQSLLTALLTTTRGVACNVDEIQNHVIEKLPRKDDFNSLDSQMIKNQLAHRTFIVRIQESKNFDIFRALKHVGLWGENFNNSASITNHSTQHYKDEFIKYEKEHESFLIFDIFLIDYSMIKFQ